MEDPANHVCCDCRENSAVIEFLHLDGRRFFLCEVCYNWADHESDYGIDFEDSDDELTIYDESYSEDDDCDSLAELMETL